MKGTCKKQIIIQIINNNTYKHYIQYRIFDKNQIKQQITIKQ